MNELLVLGCGNQGGSGLPFYSRRARLRGLASAAAPGHAAGARSAGSVRGGSLSARDAAPAESAWGPRGRQLRARASDRRPTARRRRGGGAGRRSPPDSPMAAGRALCGGGCGWVFV